MKYTLENEYLKITADTAGAELTGILSVRTGTEYMWQADEKYWKRHAPVLFPLVGNARDKQLMIGGRAYPMGQHGFARDMEFEVSAVTGSSVWFCLESNEETKGKYPYDFRLEIGYVLDGCSVQTIWKVTDTGSGDLHYQIGGHPAFNCPLPGTDAAQSDHYFLFDSPEPVRYRLLNSAGLLEEPVYQLETDGGYYRIPADMFDKDALIIEDAQSAKVSICRPDRTPFLSVLFDAPLYGLWSPAGKGAPFVCIEPWFGRADRASFGDNGGADARDIAKREYDQALAPGEDRQYSYTIRVEDL